MHKVVVAGAGLMGAHHLTLETIEALREVDVVYHLITGQEAIATLHHLNAETHSLVGMYREGSLDLEVYAQIASFVLAQALALRSVALVVMGHPSIYVAPTQLLIDNGPKYGVEVRVLPALSSIDVILAQLGFDIASTGLQILDANRLVTYGLVPQREVPLLLFQIGCFGSGFITRQAENEPARLAPLAAYLERIYPPEHPVEILECEMGWPHRAIRQELPLGALGRAGHLVSYNSTLYVPPSQAVQVRDPELLRSLLDPRAVNALVRSG